MRYSGGMATWMRPSLHELAEVADEERAEQRGDVRAVGVGVGEDADLAVAQALDVVRSGIDAEGDGDVVHFLRGEHFVRIDFPRVQDLAAQRHDRLELAVARLLRRAAGGVAFDEEQLRAIEILRACSRRACPAAPDRSSASCARPSCPACRRTIAEAMATCAMRFAVGDVVVQPDRERVLRHAGDERRGLARREPVLRLSGELRVRSCARDRM